MICDFCSSSPVHWSYSVASYTLQVCPAANSIGGWAACNACHDLIVAEDWHRLAARSVEFLGMGVQETQAKSVFIFLAIHAKFCNHLLSPYAQRGYIKWKNRLQNQTTSVVERINNMVQPLTKQDVDLGRTWYIRVFE